MARLFHDSKEVEKEYYRQSGIFPIMHTVVLREEFYEKCPWAAQSLYKAYCKAKDLCFERLLSAAALPVSLPWLREAMDETFALMSKDFWPYGLEPNRKTLSKLLQYMREQGLLPEDYKPELEELFAPNTLDTFGI
jgi:4,5-dihydroxyphthalate decarboxylase